MRRAARIIRLIPATGSSASDQVVRTGKRKKQAKWMSRKRQEAIAFIELLAPFDLLGIAAVKNIQQDDGDAEGFSRLVDPHETIEQQVSAISLALKSAVDADHRDEGSRDEPMPGPGSRIACRQFSIVDGMRVQRVEPYQLTLRRCEHEYAQVIGLCELIGCLPEKIVDLGHTGRKSRPIMPGRIERLETREGPTFGRFHRAEYLS